MTDDPDKPKKPLTAEDQQVWDDYAGDMVEKSPEDISVEDFEALLEAHDQEEEQTPVKKTKFEEEARKPDRSNGLKTDQPAQIDRRTLEKLKKGQIKIEARLDLHGMRQAEAHEALKNFMNHCTHKKLRCVLVITGKGKPRLATDSIIEPEQGVLKQKLPEWLGAANFKKDILTVIPSHKKHGGSGAFYVYLKKNR